jgi:hypothetical protein
MVSSSFNIEEETIGSIRKHVLFRIRRLSSLQMAKLLPDYLKIMTFFQPFHLPLFAVCFASSSQIQFRLLGPVKSLLPLQLFFFIFLRLLSQHLFILPPRIIFTSLSKEAFLLQVNNRRTVQLRVLDGKVS